MLIITHHTGEPQSILCAQVAATFISQKLDIPSIVVGVVRDFVQENFLAFIEDYYRGKERIICFSHICGRKDLVGLIRILKDSGFRTVLGGPQAFQDYGGEEDTGHYPLRFRGLRHCVDLAFSGPVDYLTHDHLANHKGALRFPWSSNIFVGIDWENPYIFSDKIERLSIELAQILHGIGCPYARKRCIISLDMPEFIRDRGFVSEIKTFGCPFCDVSKDKGYHGRVSADLLLEEIEALPEGGRKEDRL